MLGALTNHVAGITTFPQSSSQVQEVLVNMPISIFLSHPQPCYPAQQEFIDRIRTYLSSQGFWPRTLGVEDYSLDLPLVAIRRLMSESNGLLCIAFRRTHIEKGSGRFRSGNAYKSKTLDDQWLTSPWAHIEPAMAYQIGLPILIVRESGVLADGVLEKGIVGLYLPEFDLGADTEDYLDSRQWKDVMAEWEHRVKTVVRTKSEPPKLY